MASVCVFALPWHFWKHGNMSNVHTCLNNTLQLDHNNRQKKSLVYRDIHKTSFLSF